MTRTTLRRRVAPAAVVCAASLVLAACGGQQGGGGEDGSISGPIRVDGSSTVAPLSTAAAELFSEENPSVSPTVATSGTGGGFEQFCGGRTDISNASRPIGDDEIAACEQAGIEFAEVRVANDALSVVVNPENDWADCLTVEQLSTMWSPASEGQVTNWNQVDPSFPDAPLQLFGPGTDSGTFDYFTEVINGEEGASRADYQSSEDDNVLVQGVTGSQNATGYFGLSYVEENPDGLKPVAVDGGEGCVEPSAETALDETYVPLTRPLFIYVARDSYAEKPQVKSFIDFYVENIDSISEAADVITLSDEQKETARADLEALAG